MKECKPPRWKYWLIILNVFFGVRVVPLRANKKDMVRKKIRASTTQQKGLGFDTQTTHLGAETRAFGYLYMVMVSVTSRLGVREWSHATLGTEIGEDSSCIREGWA